MVSGPVRVQRRRTPGWRMPAGAVYVGRPSRWGNPFPVVEHGPVEAVARYRAWLLAAPARVVAARAELAGRDLACWCPPGAPCHADVLLDVANPIPVPTGPSSPPAAARPASVDALGGSDGPGTASTCADGACRP